VSSPYLLPADLVAEPLGISWRTLGAGNTFSPEAAQNQAGIMLIARQASSQADGECDQPLRCTLATEEFQAPSHRCGILPNGLGRLAASRNPITRVAYAQVTAASVLPAPTWTQLPPGASYPEETPPYSGYSNTAPGGSHGGGQGILISGQYVNWSLGRMGIRGQISYLAGWPHAGVVADSAVGDMALLVDDVAGWSGASGWLLDGGNTEYIQVGVTTQAPAPAYNAAQNYYPGLYVSLGGQNYVCMVANGPNTANGPQTPGSSTTWWILATEPAGPGTLELLTPLEFPHSAPVLVTTLPPSARWAVALLAKAQALERGVGTMTIEGAEAAGGGGLAAAISGARAEAALTLREYARVY
jgi:hypothetical protein